MISLKRDKNNDICFNSNNEIEVVEGATSLAQTVESVLKTLRGECQYDINRGIPYFSTIFENKNYLPYWENEMREQAESCSDSLEIRLFEYEIDEDDPSKLKYRMLISSPYGSALINYDGVEKYDALKKSDYRPSLIFEVNGGEEIESIKAESGTPLTPIVPTRENYNFLGWYYDPEFKRRYFFGVMPRTSLTIYAKWQGIISTIDFNVNANVNANEEELDPEEVLTFTTKEVEYGKEYGSLPKSKREGYDVAWWYQKEEDKPPIKIEENTIVDITSGKATLDAEWIASTYQITLLARNGSVLIDTKNITFNETYGSDGGLPTTEEITGYNPAITGWKFGTTEINANTTMAIAYNHSISAVMTPKTYTVTFNADGGVISGSSTKSVTYDAEYGELPTATKTDYKLIGWFLKNEEDKEDIIYGNTIVLTASNHTLKAHWTDKCNVEFVVLDDNYNFGKDLEGNVIRKVNREYKINSAYGDFPSIYNIEGIETPVKWYSDSEFTTEVVSTDEVTDDILLYAKIITQ